MDLSQEIPVGRMLTWLDGFRVSFRRAACCKDGNERPWLRAGAWPRLHRPGAALVGTLVPSWLGRPSSAHQPASLGAAVPPSASLPSPSLATIHLSSQACLDSRLCECRSPKV